MSTPSCKKRKKSPKNLSSSLTQTQKLVKMFPSKYYTNISKNLENRSISNINRKSISPEEKFNKKKSITINLKQEDNELDLMFPTHLDVIERVRKIKNLSHPLPFSPKIPPPILRN